MVNRNINIKDVTRVWHHIAPDWSRPHFEKRHRQGLLLFLGGHIECDFGAFKKEIRGGDIVKFAKSLPYSGRRLTDEAVSCIIVDFETFEEDELEKFDIPVVYKPHSLSEYLKQFFDLAELYKESTPNHQLLLKSSLYRILGMITEELDSAGNDKNADITKYIMKNLQNRSLGCKSICAHFFISESTLLRSFVHSTGYTPKEYICVQRIEKAKKLLVHDCEKTVKNVSEECGFASQYYFARSFKNITGMTPTEYRKRNFDVLEI